MHLVYGLSKPDFTYEPHVPARIELPAAVKCALVFDGLPGDLRAQSLLMQMLCALPQADLYSVHALVPSQPDFLGRTVHFSKLARLPERLVRRRGARALEPMAFEGLDLSGYDLVVSLCNGSAGAVQTAPGQLHVKYVDQPFVGSGAGLSGHYARLADAVAAGRVDTYMATSAWAAASVSKAYGRTATVLPPSVRLASGVSHGERSNLYVASALGAPGSDIAELVRVFGMMPDRKLVVLNSRHVPRHVQEAASANVAFIPSSPADETQRLLMTASAYIEVETTGFSPLAVQAQSGGTPVLAVAGSGAAEVIVPGETGLIVENPCEEGVVDAILTLERCRKRFSPEACRANSLYYAYGRFEERFIEALRASLQTHTEPARRPMAENL